MGTDRNPDSVSDLSATAGSFDTCPERCTDGGTDVPESADPNRHPETTPTRQSSTDESSLTVYEWGGGVAAGLGFFFTPILSAPVACYCAWRIREEKRISAILIVALVTSTVVFWWIILFLVI